MQRHRREASSRCRFEFDLDGGVADVPTVQRGDGIIGVLMGAHVNETESLRVARLMIEHNLTKKKETNQQKHEDE